MKKPVTLDVTNVATPGYKPALTVTNDKHLKPDGPTYYYKFTGGTDANGDVEVFLKDGGVDVEIELWRNCDKRYSFAHLFTKTVMTDGSQAQLTFENWSERLITIHDTNVKRAKLKYSIGVVDSTLNGHVILCDPIISNED